MKPEVFLSQLLSSSFLFPSVCSSQWLKLGRLKAKLVGRHDSHLQENPSIWKSSEVVWSGQKSLLLWVLLRKQSSEFWLSVIKVKSLCHVRLCDCMNWSLPVFYVHGIFQARMLEWVAISFARGSSQSRDQTWVSHSTGRLLTIWTTRDALSH